MKIYLASSYSSRELMCLYAQNLEELGHTITSHWIYGHHSHEEAKKLDQETFDRMCALDDLNGIDRCDVFIVSLDFESTKGGMHVELGYALAKNKEIYSIGIPKNVFNYLVPIENRYEDWTDFIIHQDFL